MNERMKEISADLRKKRARCSRYCAMWNIEDKDCEIFGSQHVPPSRCERFLSYCMEDEK